MKTSQGLRALCNQFCNFELMAPRNPSDATPQPAPDSPRASQSPPPAGLQGDLELEVLGLANALYNLGTTVINDSTKERDKSGGKQVGLRVCVFSSRLVTNSLSLYFRNQVISHLVTIEEMASQTRTMVPFQVLAEMDNGKNPMQLTTERIERAAAENQFMNGKIAALDVRLFLWILACC
jgi:mediator of RNA polymerase II transcription subunit 10